MRPVWTDDHIQDFLENSYLEIGDTYNLEVPKLFPLDIPKDGIAEVLVSIFKDINYIEIGYLLLESLYKYGSLNDDTDILIYTSTEFMDIIKHSRYFNYLIKFEINDTYNTIELACKARLDLFGLLCV